MNLKRTAKASVILALICFLGQGEVGDEVGENVPRITDFWRDGEGGVWLRWDSAEETSYAIERGFDEIGKWHRTEMVFTGGNQTAWRGVDALLAPAGRVFYRVACLPGKSSAVWVESLEQGKEVHTALGDLVIGASVRRGGDPLGVVFEPLLVVSLLEGGKALQESSRTFFLPAGGMRDSGIITLPLEKRGTFTLRASLYLWDVLEDKEEIQVTAL